MLPKLKQFQRPKFCQPFPQLPQGLTIKRLLLLNSPKFRSWCHFSLSLTAAISSRRYRFLAVCWEFLSRRRNYQSKKYKKRVTNRNIKITIKRKKYLTSFYVEKLFLDKRCIDLIYWSIILKLLYNNPKYFIESNVFIIVHVIVYLTKDNVSQDLSNICDIDGIVSNK